MRVHAGFGMGHAPYPPECQEFFTSGLQCWHTGQMGPPFFLVLAYTGTDFCGWQVQSAGRSVQGVLWSAVRRLWADAPMPQGTGRTDAGVHAKGQGALIRMNKDWDEYRLLAALNAHLPPDVRVRALQAAPEGFFPRHHAIAKRYVYRLDEGPSADPFLEYRRWHLYGAAPIDRRGMQAAASLLVGTHDFSSFRSRECSAATPIKTIFDIRLESSGAGLEIVFEGDRFMMHQVRIMTGTLVDVGRSRIQAEAVQEILNSKDRRKAGITAPPEGLCLEKIWYAPEWGIGEPCPFG